MPTDRVPIVSPFRPILGGLFILGMFMLISVLAGLYVAIATPGDKTVLVMMALLVYPGPFLIYGGFGFFLIHIRRSHAMYIAFNAGAILAALSWIAMTLRDSGVEDSLAGHLHETLFNSFLASLSACVVVTFIVLLLARSARKVDKHDGF